MKMSIITASFNSEATILDSVYSLKTQNYENIEHVLIDNNSSDQTVHLVRSNGIANTLIVSEQDTGIYNALNKGIEVATGDIIGFLHSDDLYLSDKTLSAVADVFESEVCDVVYGDLDYISRKNGTSVRRWRTRNFKKFWLKFGWMPPHPAVFVRRDAFNKIGLFDESYKISGDYEFILRLFYRNNSKAVHSPNVKIGMRLGGVSNKSFGNIILKMSEDMRAMKSHGINPWLGIIGKNLSKLRQFM